MNDLSFLTEYAIPVIVGICLCVGYVIKSSIPKVDNKYIPLIMAVLGLGLNVWINLSVTPEIMLGGMFSGLVSTGLHQVYKSIIEGGNK